MEVVVPILTQYKLHVASLLSKASNLSSEQTLQLVEERFEEDYDLSVAMMKIKKFKVEGDPAQLAVEWQAKMVPDELIEKVQVVSVGEGKKALTYLMFTFAKAEYIKRVLSVVFAQKAEYGSTSDYAGKKVLVEFSSPNIAKPFHAGHLRSTIIGNFLRNLYKKLGADTTAINYLGDWGTQYGLLAMGFKEFGSEEKLAENPIRHLFDVYVAANKKVDGEKAASKEAEGTEESPSRDSARSYFKRMEDGDEEALGLWRRFRDLSISEYKKVYERLNVSFDVYSGESQMTEGMIEAVKTLEARGLMQADEKGAQIVDLRKFKANVAVIKKSDGATLYITRDLAAAKSRFEQYAFDKSIYVVAAQQDLHFQQLFKMLELMGYEWADPKQGRLQHVNFGMVLGMSTRKGTVVFLEDILDEARDVMLEKMKQDKFGKLEEIENPEKTADIVGLSAVVVQDMSARRIKDYQFVWDRMTSAEGSTGPFLQYTHARLCSMEDKTADIPLTAAINPALLLDKPAMALAIAISKFPLILHSCTQNHEPSTLVTYLFDLSHAISSAHSQLRVKGSPDDIAQARKLLFWAGRMVLHNGLALIGLTPLTRM